MCHDFIDLSSYCVGLLPDVLQDRLGKVLALNLDLDWQAGNRFQQLSSSLVAIYTLTLERLHSLVTLQVPQRLCELLDSQLSP